MSRPRKESGQAATVLLRLWRGLSGGLVPHIEQRTSAEELSEQMTINSIPAFGFFFMLALAAALPAFAQSAPETSLTTESAPAASAPAETTPAAPAAPPTAKPGEEALEEDLQRWNRVLDRVEEELNEEELSLAILAQLEETVDGVRGKVNAARAPLQAKVDKVASLLAALGPAPKEGEPPEAENAAAQRRELNQLLSVPGGQLKKLDLLVQGTNLLANRIAETEGAVLAAQLLVRTPSLLSSETWAKAATEFSALGARILAVPREWSQSPEVLGTIGTGFFASGFFAVFAAALLGWYARRWLLRRFGRKPEVAEPSYRMRVLAALAEATANISVPILVAAVTYGTLATLGLLIGPFQDLMLGIVATVVWVSVLQGLPRAMLSPSMPRWRVVRMGDLAARLWYTRALTFAVIIGIDRLIIYPFAALGPSLLLHFTYSFIMNGALAAVTLAVVVDKRLWRTPEEEAQAIAIVAGSSPGPPLDKSARRSPWWLVGRTLMGVVALAVPITDLAGYGVLADHIVRRMVLTEGILLVAIVFHGLVRDLAAVFTREEEKPPSADEMGNPIYVWSVLLLDIGLVVTLVFLMVPLWGGRWENFFERVGWAMSGFKIGGRTFSLTDVLMGIVVFIVLIALVRFVQRFLDVRVLRQTRMDRGVRDAIKTGIGYAGFVIAALIAIDTAGIDLSKLAIIAGALSVGIGFGMQSIVNNFISGLILLIERPIKAGDWIVVGQDEGIVKRISMRSTEIETFSRASVIVPNSELIAGRVTNWMHKDQSGRVELPISVAYGSDTAKVREVLLDCTKGRDDVKAQPQPHVMFMDFGDSALLFELRFFIRDIADRIAIMSDVRFAIDAAFREAAITIPFPQRDVHIIEAVGKTTATEAEPAETPKSASG